MTHRNADTRIREAFDALRAELREVFGEPPEHCPTDCLSPAVMHWAANDYIDAAEGEAHAFAKLPADA